MSRRLEPSLPDSFLSFLSLNKLLRTFSCLLKCSSAGMVHIVQIQNVRLFVVWLKPVFKKIK